MASTNAAPIMENEHVRELLVIMGENRVPTMQDFLAVLTHVANMEKQLNTAVSELQTMRQELQAAREQNHPAKLTLQNAVKAVEKNIAVLRERLDTVKHNIIEGCKDAVTAFKEKGVSALDNIARFFKVRPILESMRDDLKKAIQADDRAIATIEAVSAEYHQAGRHLKNIARAVAGKEAGQDVKPVGKLAEALQEPFKMTRSVNTAMKSGVDAAINKLAQLEKAAERKPSIQKTMQAFNEQIEKAPKALSAPAAHRDDR